MEELSRDIDIGFRLIDHCVGERPLDRVLGSNGRQPDTHRALNTNTLTLTTGLR